MINIRWMDMESALINLAKGDRQAKDRGRLLRVPGTMNYKDREHPKEVKIIFASGKKYLEQDFEQLVKDHGPKNTPNVIPKTTDPLGFTPPCIAYLLDPNTRVPQGYRHIVRFVLGIFMFHESITLEGAVEKVKHFTDDPRKSESDMQGIYATLQSDPEKYHIGCGDGSYLRNLLDDGVTVCDKTTCQFCTPKAKSSKTKKEEEKQEEPVKSAHFDNLVDLVLDDAGVIAFLILDGNNLVVKHDHIVDGQKVVPPPKDKVRWLIPKASAIMNHFTADNDRALYDDLVDYYRTISDLPADEHFLFNAAFAFHTYVVEKSEYSPIIWYFAIPERGKSRTGKAIIYSSYRGVHVVTLREAHLIRLAQDLRATLFIDISDLQKKIEAAGVEDVLLNRYERGATIARVLYPDRGAFDDTIYYEIYGPTVVATNETVNDILATRTIQVVMPEASRSFTNDVKEIDALPFRERLLGFKARWMTRDLPNVDKPCLGRLGDILRPIRQIVNIVSPDEKWFLDLVKNIEQQRKSSGSDSFDAEVVSAILDSKMKMCHNHILHDDILTKLNANRSEREKITPQKLGKITARLGFEKYSSGQQRGIMWNKNLIIKLSERYGIDHSDVEF